MGIGDDIMVTAVVRRMQARDPRPVAVTDKAGAPRWHWIWDGNPRIARRAQDRDAVQWLDICGGRRPWIAGKSRDRFVFQPWANEPGELYLSAAERAWAAAAVPADTVLVHCTAGRAVKTVNMDWGRARWAALIRRLEARGVPVAELATPGQAPLARRVVSAPDFRHACAAVGAARLFVTPEGGLHHAAAALGTRAVVLWGGFAPPAVLGYAAHVNLAGADAACGRRNPCDHCRQAWAAIDPAAVADLTEVTMNQTDFTALNAPSPAPQPPPARGGGEEGLIDYRGLWLPAHERHLQGWMDSRMRSHPDELVDGKPTYQLHKLRAAVRRVPKDRRRTAIDVGAHVGLWSMHLARLFDRVDAFEPVALHRAAWERNVTAPNAVLHPVALGAADGRCRIHTTEGSSGDSWPQAGDDVDVCPLDQVAGIADVDLIKIDCEGWELFVLQGAARTIADYRPVIVVEQKPGKAAQHGLGERDAVAWLHAHGYATAEEISGDFIMVPA